jgi:hypothetical protein
MTNYRNTEFISNLFTKNQEDGNLRQISYITNKIWRHIRVNGTNYYNTGNNSKNNGSKYQTFIPSLLLLLRSRVLLRISSFSDALSQTQHNEQVSESEKRLSPTM